MRLYRHDVIVGDIINYIQKKNRDEHQTRKKLDQHISRRESRFTFSANTPQCKIANNGDIIKPDNRFKTTCTMRPGPKNTSFSIKPENTNIDKTANTGARNKNEENPD